MSNQFGHSDSHPRGRESRISPWGFIGVVSLLASSAIVAAVIYGGYLACRNWPQEPTLGCLAVLAAVGPGTTQQLIWLLRQ